MWWMLRPAEISWASDVVFSSYREHKSFFPAPFPLVRDVVAHRLELGQTSLLMYPWERFFLLAHSGITLFLLLSPRIRSALIVLTVLLILHAIIVPRQKTSHCLLLESRRTQDNAQL